MICCEYIYYIIYICSIITNDDIDDDSGDDIDDDSGDSDSDTIIHIEALHSCMLL